MQEVQQQNINTEEAPLTNELPQDKGTQLTSEEKLERLHKLLSRTEGDIRKKILTTQPEQFQKVLNNFM